MALDETRKTRDYLFGRLLAVADNMEQWALREGNEKRQTNAARLMQRFADHPSSTWRTIDLALMPYRARLGKKANGLQRMLEEIMSLFDTEDYVNDAKLSGEYLLGYYCQLEKLHNRNKDSDRQSDDEDTEE